MDIINKDELLAELRVSARTLENWVKAGTFPPGVRIGKRMTWSKKAVEHWRQQTYAFQLQFRRR